MTHNRSKILIITGIIVQHYRGEQSIIMSSIRSGGSIGTSSNNNTTGSKSAWGVGSTSNAWSSCADLIARVERNDPNLVDLYILPNKVFGDEELNRLSSILEARQQQQQQDAPTLYHWKALYASGHAVSETALERWGRALRSNKTTTTTDSRAAAITASTTTNTTTACNVSSSGSIQHLAIGDEATFNDSSVAALIAGLLGKNQGGDADECQNDEGEVKSIGHSLLSLDLSAKHVLTVSSLHAVANLVSSSVSFTSLSKDSSSSSYCHLTTLNLSRNPNLFQSVHLKSSSTITITTLAPTSHANNTPSSLGTLLHLDLTGCGLHAVAAKTILAPLLAPTTLQSIIATSCRLQVLRLCHNSNLTWAGLHALSLPTACPTLQELYVSHCGLWTISTDKDDDAACALDPSGTGNSPMVQGTSATTTSIETTTGLEIPAHLLLTIPWPQTCHTLDLSNNSMTAPAAMSWCLAMEKNGWNYNNWSTINLAGNPKLGSEGAVVFETLIKALFDQGINDGLCSNLPIVENDSANSRSLDFSETGCGATAAAAAVQACIAAAASSKGTRNRMTLRLYGNKLGLNNGFGLVGAALLEALVATQNTERAQQPTNETTDIGRFTLDMAGNDANQDSVVALLEAVFEMVSTVPQPVILLESLVIGGNEGGALVEDVVRRIHSLQPNIDIARDKIPRQQEQ